MFSRRVHVSIEWQEHLIFEKQHLENAWSGLNMGFEGSETFIRIKWKKQAGKVA